MLVRNRTRKGSKVARGGFHGLYIEMKRKGAEACLRHKSGGLLGLKNRCTRPCAAMDSRRLRRRLESICRREFEMDMKNIGNPLTIEQLREKVEKWNRREAQK